MVPFRPLKGRGFRPGHVASRSRKQSRLPAGVPEQHGVVRPEFLFADPDNQSGHCLSGVYGIEHDALSARDQLQRVEYYVQSGVFDSPGAVLREALKTWLLLRSEEACRHAAIAAHIGLPFGASADLLPPDEPCERVELLFDAADAKA